MISSLHRLIVVFAVLIVLTGSSRGDDPAAAPKGAAAEAPAAKFNIVGEQQAIVRDLRSFEKRLAEVSEGLRGSDLDRSNLLNQARSEIQRNQLNAKLDEIVAILSEKRPYADAVERQKAVLVHMEEILRILQTDAERDRLQSRIKELEAVLKDTNRIIAAQKDVRADTERGGDFRQLEEKESQVLKSAKELGENIDRQDAERRAEQGERPSGEQPSGKSDEENKSNGNQQSENKPGDQKPGEKSPDKPTGDDSSKPGKDSPSGDSPQGQSQQSQSPQDQSPQGPPQPGESQQGQQQQGQQRDQTPGREELQRAAQEMQQAIEQLQQQNRDKASDEQDQAIAQLEALKAQLEEILRQLREEERELHLTMLEARFQEMLKLQLRINADTVRLDARDEAERGEAHFTKSRDLSRQERQNLLMAEKALTLLKEEGSSVAFPEAVDQMRSNMGAVADRLFQGETGRTVQLIEQLIIESLQEMIASLQEELDEMKEQQQQQQQQEGGSEDQQLVKQIAELKMVRSLQNQVNRLTRQLGEDLKGEQSDDPDTLRLLQDLAARQQRIQEATYDLATGRNK